MSSLDTYELTHPESLSERQLREILKNVSFIVQIGCVY